MLDRAVRFFVAMHEQKVFRDIILYVDQCRGNSTNK